ncbi:MAG TPA: 50S ribosomal protein L9 [Gemmatimonadetes bacterium]|jgi:large subunit ribosomal protein L9|nr:50S ribosomal protein L9 [Gemmatimonadota bacterium]
MKLILKETVKGLGEPGDIVEVKAGYARNYLIPQGLSYLANTANLRKLEEEKTRLDEETKRDYLEAKRRAVQLEGVSISFQVLAAEDGKLFGSVTNLDIVERLNEGSLDFAIDRSMVQMEDSFKMIGKFTLPMRLHEEVVMEIDVHIEQQEEN